MARIACIDLQAQLMSCAELCRTTSKSLLVLNDNLELIFSFVYSQYSSKSRPAGRAMLCKFCLEAAVHNNGAARCMCLLHLTMSGVSYGRHLCQHSIVEETFPFAVFELIRPWLGTTNESLPILRNDGISYDFT